ncbi:MAG: hypothetical protein HOV83_16985, partial [Catenulispora sp.]|nr:hypothetical protein [Catenulispora sp.]
LEVWTGDVNAWHDYSTVPRIGDNRLLGFVALAAAIPASVYLGRRGVPAGWPRRAVLAAEGVLGVVAFVALVTGIAGDDRGSGANPYQVGYVQQPYGSGGLVENGRLIANLWVYDKDGKRIDGVYIYDQDGQPVSAIPPGDLYGGDIDGGAWVDGDGQLITNRYPRQVLRGQYDTGNTAHYIPVPPPAVSPPKGVHQASDPQPGPSTASTASTPGAPSTPQGSANTADPAPSGTPATPSVSTGSP